VESSGVIVFEHLLLSEGEIALSKLACMVCLFAAVPVWGLAQTTNPFQPLSPGQTQEGQQAASSSSGVGQIPLPSPIRTDPTTITNVPPGQDLTDYARDLDAQQRRMDRPTPTPMPEPDLEFQGFVASSLGASLPIFGQDLFGNVPSTFAPLDRVQVPPDYVLGPGDELIIRAWGQISVDVRAIIDRSGAIYIPRVGVFNVAGLRYEELHDSLNSEIGRIFKNFQLSVTMGRLRSIQVFVVGQAKRPGTYTISSLSSLVDALFASGGPSKRGSLRRIQVKRDGKTVTTFDLYDLIVNGDKSKDAKLMHGDVIYIPPVGPLVALSGSINTPAVFELKDRTSLADVIGYAGGLATTAAGQSVVVERIDDHRVRRAEEFTLNQEGLARELHDGDVIRFLRIRSGFDNAVTLRGNVAVPGRYPWRRGMRIHDLIPDREFLVTDEYWKHQNQLALVARASDFRINPAELKNDVQRMSSEINWRYAVIQRMNPQDLTPHILPFDLGKAIEGDSQQNLELQANDVVTIFSQTDIEVPIADRTKFVHLEGELREAGVFQVQPGETLRHLIERVGGFTPQAYLYGAEFTRESTRIDQQERLDQYVNNLGQSAQQTAVSAAYLADTTSAAEAKAAADRDRLLVERMKGLRATGRIVLELRPNAAGAAALPDLVLEDGDRLVVPFRPATISVIGSVYNSSAFIYKPGKTVSDYLRLAGGPSRAADAGREFVIRANGSTVSKQQYNTLLSGSFGSIRLMPGDTIIVPVKLDRGAALRALRDWATIVGQFGLAAGGIRAIFP
jgi:polysaccharide biosynthesis/export protein